MKISESYRPCSCVHPVFDYKIYRCLVNIPPGKYRTREEVNQEQKDPPENLQFYWK